VIHLKEKCDGEQQRCRGHRGIQIGWGTTKVLISKGFRVFGSVRKQADADRLQSEFGNAFVPLMMDIMDADAVYQAAQKVGSMIGDTNLVGLVNNAGIVVSGPLLYLRPSAYKRRRSIQAGRFWADTCGIVVRLVLFVSPPRQVVLLGESRYVW
jgi:NAD(P)-dependent dehydrogenase (short-subunit alcohol dehydrogenase family)